MDNLVEIKSLAVALGTSLALHAGTLALLAHPADGWRRQAGGMPTAARLNVVALPTRAMPQQRDPLRISTAPEHQLLATPVTATEPPPVPAPQAITGPRPGDDARTQLGIGIAPYLPAKLLDERPRVVFDIPSELPQLSGHPEGGKLVMTLKIGASGNVDDIEVDATTLPNVFAEETARAFRQARFTPGRKDGIAVGTLLRIEVHYRPLVTPPTGRQFSPAPTPSNSLGKGKSTPSE